MGKTIAAELKVIPNRYTLTRVISLRVNELLRGAAPKLDQKSELIKNSYKNGLTFGNARLIAMKEICEKSIPYSHTKAITNHLDEEAVIFN